MRCGTPVLDRTAGRELLDQLQDLALREATFAPLEHNLAALTALGGVEPQLAGHIHTSLRLATAALAEEES